MTNSLFNPVSDRIYGYEDTVINTDDLNNQNKVNSSYTVLGDKIQLNKEHIDTSAYIYSSKHVNISERGTEVSKGNALLNKGNTSGFTVEGEEKLDNQNFSQTLTDSFSLDDYKKILITRNFSAEETIEKNNTEGTPEVTPDGSTENSTEGSTE